MTNSIANTEKNKRTGPSGHVRLSEGALFSGAFFYSRQILKPEKGLPKTTKMAFLIALTCLCFTASPGSLAACHQQKIDLQTRGVRIIDGDTIDIANGKRIRLIGINTPEIGYRGKSSERFAAEAKQAISAMLRSSAYRIKLQFGQERYDRYGRTLAHVFLADGRNIAEQLLLQGLAVRVAFPPNLWGQDCYHSSERQARRVKKALWRDNITPVGQLQPGQRGFQIVRGEVTRIGQSKKSIWLNLGDHFAVRIARRDLGQFQSVDPRQLLHKTLQVRGWIVSKKNKSIMHLRHSSMLEIMK